MPSKKEQKKEEMSEEKAQPRVVQDRYTKLAEIRALGINPYPYKYEPTAHSEQLIQSHLKLKENERTKELFRVAGRIVSLRKMGKISFGHVQDQKGRIQFLIHQDIDPEQYRLFELLDLGDIVGIEGQIFKTKTGEVTIDVNKLTLLCKTLYPLPEKWHGIQDPELKYRKRYLHLIMSPEVKNVFITREKIINAVRQHLTDKSFIEVDTPILQPIYGGAAAKPFKTHLNSLNMDVYLRISNELYLKRLIVGGFERVFEFSKDFRNEGIDRTHNPEFLSMECYQAYADYNDMMELTEDMISSIAKKINGTTKLDYQGMKIDFKKPWNRLTMADALKKFAKIDVVKMKENELKDLITEHKIEMTIEPTVGHMINELFEKLVADKIVEPTFIMDHPKETTPLCKIHRKNPALVERFEPMVCGMEIGNAYSELNDPVLQKKFLEEQAAQLRSGSAEAHPMDEDFVRAIEYGMPPTGGLGIGIDRIVMLLTNQPSIRDVLLFPFMRLEK